MVGEEDILRMTNLGMATAERYDRTFIRPYTDEEVTGLGESFSIPELPKGEIYHGC